MPETNGKPLSDVACTVCGNALPVQLGAGRPREMHAHCQQLGKVLAWLETALSETAPYMDHGARQRIRTRIFTMLENMDGERFIGRTALAKIVENNMSIKEWELSEDA